VSSLPPSPSLVGEEVHRLALTGGVMLEVKGRRGGREGEAEGRTVAVVVVLLLLLLVVRMREVGRSGRRVSPSLLVLKLSQGHLHSVLVKMHPSS